MSDEAIHIALRLVDEVEEPANRRRRAALVREAVVGSGYAEEVVEVAAGFGFDAEVASTSDRSLGWALYELGRDCPDDARAGRLLAAAAVLRELHEDPQVGLETAIEALRRDPGNAEARELFGRLAEEPDEAPVYADAMEGLAEDVVRGKFPRTVFMEMLAEVAGLGEELERARGIVGEEGHRV